MKGNIKQIQLNRNPKQLVLLVINIILVTACILLGIYAGKSRGKLYSQQEAKRWESKKNSYAQVSAFASPNRNLQKEDITAIRGSLMAKLSEDSLNESKGNARVWIDAYSGECPAEVRKDTNTLSVTAVGVGGDFFQFHPIPLLSGSYISSGDLNQDRVVVDENFAWAMFGSNDIVGMQIWMGDNIYTIAGVVEVNEDSLYRIAYGEGNRIYMSYDMLKKQQEELKITCYEAVLPNPISNYAYYALRKACGLEEEEEDTIKKTENPLNFDTVEVVENSNRFQWLERITGLKNRKYRVMRTSTVGYPFWENLARVEECRQENILIVRILLLICPCSCLVLWLYGLWSRRKWTVKGICVNVLDRIREQQEKTAEERQREKEELEAEELLENAVDAIVEATQEEAEVEKVPQEDTEIEEVLQDETEIEEVLQEETEMKEKSQVAEDEDDTQNMPEQDENQELQSVTSEDIFQM